MVKTLMFIVGLTLATPGIAGELLQFNKIDEIPEGPGLFSKGSVDGVVVFSTVYSSTFSGANDAVENTSTPEPATTHSPQATPSYDKEYQKFLEWQREQFQQWRKTNESNN